MRATLGGGIEPAKSRRLPIITELCSAMTLVETFLIPLFSSFTFSGLASFLALATLWLSLLFLWMDARAARARVPDGCVLPPGPPRTPVVGFLLRLDPLAPYLTLTELTRTYGKVRNQWRTEMKRESVSHMLVEGVQLVDGLHSLRGDRRCRRAKEVLRQEGLLWEGAFRPGSIFVNCLSSNCRACLPH